MEALAQVLTREQVLVELLAFKLVTMRQLLLTGETRFLPWAGEEVERAAAKVREVELERAVVTEGLAAARGLVDPTLRELVTDAPEPWRSLLEDLAESLRESTLEVTDLLASNRRLAEAGANSIAQSLGELEAPSSSPVRAAYSESGGGARRVSQVL